MVLLHAHSHLEPHTRSHSSSGMKTVRLDLHALPAHATSPLGAAVARLKGDALATVDVGRLPLSMRPWGRSSGSAWRGSASDARSRSVLRRSLDVRHGDQRALLVLGRCTTLTPVPEAATPAAGAGALVKEGPQAYYIVLLIGRQLAVWQLHFHGPGHAAKGRGDVDMAFFPKAAAVPAQRQGRSISPDTHLAQSSTRRESTSARSASPPPFSVNASASRQAPSDSAPIPALASASASASAPASRAQPDTSISTSTSTSASTTSTASTAQKNALKRMVVTSLRLRGIERSHAEFRDLYTNTLQAASFALRRLGTGTDGVAGTTAGAGAGTTTGAGTGTGAAAGSRATSRAQKDAAALWERKAVVHVENLLQMFLS